MFEIVLFLWGIGKEQETEGGVLTGQFWQRMPQVASTTPVLKKFLEMAVVRLFRPNDILVEVFNGNADRDTFQVHHLSCSEGMECPEIGGFSSEEINRLLLGLYQDVFLQRGKASIVAKFAPSIIRL